MGWGSEKDEAGFGLHQSIIGRNLEVSRACTLVEFQVFSVMVALTWVAAERMA